MRRLRTRTTPARPGPLAAATFLAIALPACDLSTTDPAPPVAGEWLAVEYVVASGLQPSETVSLIPGQGWFRFISLSPGGYHEDTRWSPGARWSSSAGRWNANDSTLFIDYGPDADTQEWHYELGADDRLEITRFIVDGYDFDDDGTPDPTTATTELVRSETNPDPALLDSWAAQAYTFTSVADTTVSYDVIADGGSYTATFFQTATYQFSETIPGSDGTRSDSREFAATQGLIWLIDGNSIEFGTYTFEGTTLVITFESGAWDFDDDGTAEPATRVLRLTPA